MQSPKTIEFKEVGKRLQKWRLEQGLTQKKLAERLGFQVGYIARVEGGNLGISQESLLVFAKQMGMDMNWLLTGHTGNGNGTPPPPLERVITPSRKPVHAKQ